MKNESHDLKEFPLMDWRWWGESRRGKNNLRDHEYSSGVSPSSKYLFELTK